MHENQYTDGPWRDYDDDPEPCDNSGRTAGDLGVPGCWDNEATVTLRIEYDPHGIETDVVDVCEGCADAVRREAESHGYTVETV